jgi:hypothetical protein
MRQPARTGEHLFVCHDGRWSLMMVTLIFIFEAERKKKAERKKEGIDEPKTQEKEKLLQKNVS